ncbi:MAG TPA: hypothetical protein VK308_13760, partial [Pyrinomonadaceae bacterium]|nr:hypothetical protein [Pyrinomonadaceae bacterium]
DEERSHPHPPAGRRLVHAHGVSLSKNSTMLSAFRLRTRRLARFILDSIFPYFSKNSTLPVLMS